MFMPENEFTSLPPTLALAEVEPGKFVIICADNLAEISKNPEIKIGEYRLHEIRNFRRSNQLNGISTRSV